MAERLNRVIYGCEASIDADTEAEMVERAEAHAAEAHPDLELDDETVETLEAHMHEV